MLKEALLALVSPITEIIKARETRKAAKEAALAKLTQAQAENAQQLELNKDEWEALNIQGQASSWKDEYVTVSVVSLFNLIAIGGLATAFGFPQILTGVVLAVQALVTVGVDVGFLLEATILSAIGISVWKKVF